MTDLLRAQPARRLFAAWVAFGYFWLCVIVPFHNHDHGNVFSLSLNASHGQSNSSAHPTQRQITANAALQGASHCAACDWDAANVSQAVAAFVLSLEKPVAPRVITTFPCYLRLKSISTSARAPPVV